jgi:hypothetical protein
MKEDNITASDISMQILDLQHQILRFALGRQVFLIEASALEERLQLFQKGEIKHSQEIFSLR